MTITILADLVGIYIGFRACFNSEAFWNNYIDAQAKYGLKSRKKEMAAGRNSRVGIWSTRVFGAIFLMLWIVSFIGHLKSFMSNS